MLKYCTVRRGVPVVTIWYTGIWYTMVYQWFYKDPLVFHGPVVKTVVKRTKNVLKTYQNVQIYRNKTKNFMKIKDAHIPLRRVQ